MQQIATCALGLEEILQSELAEIGARNIQARRGAVSFEGDWPDCWRANWRLRTANRVLIELGRWNGASGEALSMGARAWIRRKGQSWGGVPLRRLFDPRRTFAIRATSSRSRVNDTRWVGLKVKDGLVDGQREVFGKRSSIDRDDPHLSLRVWLHEDRASLLLDTSGEPLDRRGYRVKSSIAPVREQLAAACVLASGWGGEGPVLDPMCGSGTLLLEAASFALGRSPGVLRESWAFKRLPGFDQELFRRVCEEPIPAPGPEVRLFGGDRSGAALAAARANLRRARLAGISKLRQADAFDWEPPSGSGLLLVNPAYGERLEEEAQQWRRLGDLLKQRFKGWRAVVLAGGERRGKDIGLRPSRRLPVRNGALDTRILTFELY